MLSPSPPIITSPGGPRCAHLQLRDLLQQLRSLWPPPARQEGTSILQSTLSTGTDVLTTAGWGAGGHGDVAQGHLHGRLLGTQLPDGLTQGPLL